MVAYRMPLSGDAPLPLPGDGPAPQLAAMPAASPVRAGGLRPIPRLRATGLQPWQQVVVSYTDAGDSLATRLRGSLRHRAVALAVATVGAALAGAAIVAPSVLSEARVAAPAPAPAVVTPIPATSTTDGTSGNVTGDATHAAIGASLEADRAAFDAERAAAIAATGIAPWGGSDVSIEETIALPAEFVASFTPAVLGSHEAASDGNAAAEVVPRVHTVVPGDTLSGIAAGYGTTVDALLATNSLEQDAIIHVGDELRLP